MTNQGISKVSLQILDRFTDAFPSVVPRIFQKIFVNILGSRTVYSFYFKKFRRQLREINNFERILVVVDVNIGDAIMMQQIVKSLRLLFPGSRIDYICNKKGGGLVAAFPEADHVYKVFTGAGLMSGEDEKEFYEITRNNDYSIIFNFFAFLKCSLRPEKIIDMYVPLSAYMVTLWKSKAVRRDISSVIKDFLFDFLDPFIEKKLDYRKIHLNGQLRYFSRKGNSIYIDHPAIESAKNFLHSNNLFPAESLVFFNPDSNSVYTLIPLELQIQIIKNILSLEEVNALLLGTGRSNKGIESKILSALPERFAKRVIVVPQFDISTYAALIDACDVFVTADTGPAHIAASWKIPVAKLDRLRNRTSLITIFGATDSRMYGYDSTLYDHVPANQTAPSKVFKGDPPCRNITCINKAGKSCKVIRCFNGLNADEVSDYVGSYLKSIRKKELISDHNSLTEIV